MKTTYLVLSMLLIATTISFGQTTVSLTPFKDNSIFENNQLNSNGAGASLYSGQTCFSSNRRALIQFDLSSIPAGATITNVTLDLNCTNVSASGTGSDTYDIYGVTQNWGEGSSSTTGGSGTTAVAPDATWSNAETGGAPWLTLGGDYIPTSLASLTINGPGNYTFLNTTELITIAQTWLDTPGNNFGIILIGNESTSCTARRFDSREGTTPPSLNVTYTVPPCTTAPTAICQSITVYLDASGNASITGSDLDGGSIDNCATSGLTFAASQTAFTCADITAAQPEGLMITGAYDGPLSGGTPKGVELYVTGDIADLSTYGLGSANNGQGSDGEEFTFPAVSVSQGDFIYVTTDSAQFVAFFGFAPDYVSGAMSINGDDAIELFHNSAVIDVFGDINMDGTGEPWDHVDGWAYRNNFETINNGTFDDQNWFYSGTDAFDGETSNATAATPFPVEAFLSSTGGTLVTLTVTDGNGSSATCDALVTILDTIAPTADIASLADVTGTCEVSSLVAPTATDNCSAVTVTNDATLPINSAGTTVVTWTYTDDNGNASTQVQNVIITPLSSTDTQVACGSFTWIDGNTYTASNDTATFTTTATAGCDSVITLNLTINTEATGTDVQEACGSFTWIDGNTYTASTDTATFVVAGGSSNGCDSIVTLNLTINTLDVSTTTAGATITASANGATYQWIDCSDNSEIQGATNQSFTAATSGEYAVIVTDGNCTDTSACVLIDTSNLNELDNAVMAVYPNPTNGAITVEFTTVSGTLSIYEMNGKLIQSITPSSNSETIDVSQLKSGMYQLIYTNDTHTIRKQFVKQ